MKTEAGACRCPTCGEVREVSPMPLSVTCVLTERCTQKCAMCGYHGSDEPRDMELSLLDRLLDELRPLPPRSFVLTGGEPTLHPAFEQVLERLDDWPGGP